MANMPPPNTASKLHKLREPEERDCVFLEKIMLSMNTHYNSQKADELRAFLLEFRNDYGLPYGMQARYRFVRDLYVELEVRGLFKFTKEEKDFRVFLTTEIMHLLTVQAGSSGSDLDNYEEEVETIYHSGPSSTQISAARRAQAALEAQQYQTMVQVDKPTPVNKRRRAHEEPDIPTKDDDEVAESGTAKRRRRNADPLHALKSSLEETIYKEKDSPEPGLRRSARRVKIQIEQPARRRSKGRTTERQSSTGGKTPQLRPASLTPKTISKKPKPAKHTPRTLANKKPTRASTSSVGTRASQAGIIVISSPDILALPCSSTPEPRVLAPTNPPTAQRSESPNNDDSAAMETSTVSTELLPHLTAPKPTTAPHSAAPATITTPRQQTPRQTTTEQLSAPPAHIPTVPLAQAPRPPSTLKDQISDAEKALAAIERQTIREAFRMEKKANNEMTTSGWLGGLAPQTTHGRVTMGPGFDDN